MPHPMSQNAPNGSSRVILASITSPVFSLLIFSRIQSRWASLRERIARGVPNSLRSIPMILKKKSTFSNLTAKMKKNFKERRGRKWNLTFLSLLK